MKRLAILVSGTGSIMDAIFKSAIPVAAVIADRECAAIRRVRSVHRCGQYVVPRTSYMYNGVFERFLHTQVVGELLRREEIDLVMMAGYKTLLHASIFDRYRDRIINTHPSLLPAFRGEHAVRDALAYGVKLTGCTMHYATEVLDEGPIIDQYAVAVQNFDTVESLHERIKVKERYMVPKNLERLLAE